MKVIRQGSRRSGSSSEIVRDKVPKITWDSSRKSVTLNVRNNPDGYGSQWDYWVHLGVSDLREVMACLAEKGIADCPDEISREFSPQLDKLLKIILCSVGVVSADGAKKAT
ncbi:MAG TPA: hypothetical protein DC054_23130 [Blastocatellia bacterium]|jgi:hypothetical protein|nr:hypothetical protein [Blastocatellia bacterium]